jgi:alkaline phosphatase D
LLEYGSGEFGNLRAYEPAFETVTLSDYRTRHAQYKRDADLQEVHRQHPMIAIWDDHEFANNAYATGAQNHTPATEGLWTARVTAALQAYYEWMPVRVVDATDLRKNNRSFAFGDLVDLVMLEERLLARSPQLITNESASGAFAQSGAFVDPARQMLGTAEEDWLATRLRGSTAKWKLVGQGVMFAQLKLLPDSNADGGGVFFNADQWDGYQPARDRVYGIINGNASFPAVSNIVVLSGDIHSSWAADLTQDPNNSDLASGGYDPSTGAGSRAVEFVATSVTSPAVLDTGGLAESTLRSINPHFKYIDLSQRGYMLIDADPTRVVCEWWYVDTIAAPSSVESFGTAFGVSDGANLLVATTQTAPRTTAPLLAP